MLTKTKMRNRIKAVTEGLRCNNPEELDPILQSLVTKVISNMGPNSHSVIELISYLTKVDLKNYVLKKENKLKPLACYISVVQYQNYKPGTLLVVDSSCRPVSESGVQTSHLKSEVRLATNEEIDKLTDVQIEYMIKDYSGC